MLSLEKINEYLCNELKGIDINIFDEVTSTNTLLKEQAKNKNEWTLIAASSQTAGRGRQGKSFFSPQNTGVYFSVLLKPRIALSDIGLITTAAAVSVVDALEKLGVTDAKIKWVNDIFVNDKKVSGILTEGELNQEKNELDFAVLGVGINLFNPENNFPCDLEQIAGAVFKEKQEDARNKVIAYFLNSFYEYYKDLTKKTFFTRYKEKCFVLGKEITVVSNGESKKATALNIDENFYLEVEFDSGNREKLSSGEISIKI